ncbi:MAG: asparagine synthetase B [Gemmatimonadota bacterium]|nr:asparagine synthetase B [Gemmatimonadota bacterium]
MLALVALVPWAPFPAHAAKVLIPMDLSQRDHLKAYGIAYWALTQGVEVDWVLNYRGGSFLTDDWAGLRRRALLANVTLEDLSTADRADILSTVEAENREVVRLEEAPRVAIYTPPGKQPWDDAVTLALTYAEIPYDTVWDQEVLAGRLDSYDWLHLHHEDFTGQYGKFYASFHAAPWYQRQQTLYEKLARDAGFRKVSEHKAAVTEVIRAYIREGGFLFAMCSATDTFDIAMAARGVDIVGTVYDGDPADSDAQGRLDYSRCLAFRDFTLVRDPLEYEFSDIDTSDYARARGARVDYFTLFEFSAKYDPIPTMLTQCHVGVVNGFLGQTTGFDMDFLRPGVTVLAQVEGTREAKYIHGKFGRGTWTFYGGHDPEDYQHAVGDPPTELSRFPNSSGYRLILNNVLFPAAKKKPQKT